MCVWNKSITEPAAFYGMLAGFLSTVVLQLLRMFDLLSLPVYLDPILVGAAISLLTILVAEK